MLKRTASEDLAMNDGELDYELENEPMTESCDVIRRKIRTFIESGDMKVGEFQKAIDVTSNAYSRFMGQSGPFKGFGSSVYGAAWSFFKRRELRGQNITKKKARASKAEATGTGSSARMDLKGVLLDGEMEDHVQVYDTCDEIRRKINAYLKKPHVTQAQFLRDIGDSYHMAPKKITAPQLTTFRSKRGPYTGNTSVVFYGAYVFFEKMRVKDGKPKGKKRQEMEDIWAAKGGIDIEHRRDKVWAPRGATVSQDRYGLTHIR